MNDIEDVAGVLGWEHRLSDHQSDVYWKGDLAVIVYRTATGSAKGAELFRWAGGKPLRLQTAPDRNTKATVLGWLAE